MTERRPIRRALVSVYNKTGLPELAAGLHDAGVEIVSTGSTAQVIREQGIPVADASEVTKYPEMLDGRVKTLHPAIHGGILADTRRESHQAHIAQHGIAPFDLVIVNLYPFEETVAEGGSFEEIIEKIDIGGPAMVRSAAKNFENVTVIVEAEHYGFAVEAAAAGGTTRTQRLGLASIAFARIAAYDAAIDEWMMEQAEAAVVADASGTEDAEGEMSPEQAEALGITVLRYGENAHQSAWIQRDDDAEGSLAAAQLLGGKPMSYNNYVDADAALRAAFDHQLPCVAVIKHNNPCGIAVAGENEDIAVAHAKAHGTDPVSAYGGVIAANRPVTLAMAQQVAPIFTEVIVAPGYEPEALSVLQSKKNLRILEIAGTPRAEELREVRPIWGGTLEQDIDRVDAVGDDPANWTLVAGAAADEQTLADLEFAWRSVRAVKSNAILLARDGAAVGIGMGQVNRLDSCRLAVSRANTLGEHEDTEAAPERARGAVAASDAFFPFADGLQILIEAGITAVVQPGGSIRDDEVIAACEAAGVTMYVTGTRHFAH